MTTRGGDVPQLFAQPVGMAGESETPWKRPIRVCFLVGSQARHGCIPSARFRVLQYLPYLKKAGIIPVVRPSRPSKFFQNHWIFRLIGRYLGLRFHRAVLSILFRCQRLMRYWDFRRAKGCDVVVIQKDLEARDDSRLEDLLLYFNDRIIFDFDDAVFARPSWSRQGPDDDLVHPESNAKISRIVQMASHVVVSTPFLAEFARAWNPRVTVIPTPVDTQRYVPPARPPRNDPLIVGWMGTSSNLYYLREILQPLERLSRRHQFVLRVICNDVPDDQKPFLKDGNCEFHTWSLAREVHDLQQFDVGLMPLQDDTWTRGKAGFKLITYMACGVPCVASPVGFNPRVLGRPGLCGYYSRCPTEWHDALDALLSSAADRHAMGLRGRARAVAHFDVGTHARSWVDLIREVAAT